MAQHKLLFALFVLSIIFFPGCSQNAQVTDTTPKVTQSKSSDTALTDDERCTKYDTRESMLYKEARDLAEKSACAIDGKLKSTHWCNTATGTWEIDTMIEKAGCMPTCLINVVTKETEINWKCTGAKDPNQITTTSTTHWWRTPATIGSNLPQEDPSPAYNMSYTPEEGPKGAFLLELRDDWFNSDIDGYKFKIDHFLYASEYTVRGAVIDVMRPDGTIVQARFGFDECYNTYYDAQVDDIILRLRSASPLQTWKAKVYVWNYKNIPVMKKAVLPEKPYPNAKLLADVTSEGFTTQYGDYKFKVDHLEYSGSYHANIVVLDVEKPDGTIVELAIREGMNSRIDNLNVASPFCGTVEEAPTMQTAAIWVWEGSSSGTTILQKEIYPLVYTPDKPPQSSTPIDVSSEGFRGQYNGYKFKIDRLIYASPYGVSGIFLDVQNPDGTIVVKKLGYDECHNTYYDIQVADIVLRLISAHEVAAVQEGRIYAWNYKTTPVIQKQIPYEKPNTNAKLLEGVSNEGFMMEYNGYKFKIDSLEYSSEYHPSAVVLDVQRPDGTIKQVTVKEASSTKVDNLNIASPFCGAVEEAAALETASLWVW